MEVRGRTVLLMLIAALLAYLFWTYGILDEAVGRAAERIQEFQNVHGAHASAATVKPVGAWQPAPDVIGALFLAHCHGYTAWPFYVRPAMERELAAVAEAPDAPALPRLLAASRAFFIPRSAEAPKADVDAWTAGRTPDCNASPWPGRALKRLPTPDPALAQRLKRADEATARRLLAKIHTFRVFAVARPVLRDDAPYWELRFYATER